MKNFINKFYTILIPQVFAKTGENALTNPLSSGSIPDLIESVAKLASQIGIPIAAIFIIYSGILFITARGSEEQLKKARENFYWSVIGAGILLGAWVIAKAIATTVKGL